MESAARVLIAGTSSGVGKTTVATGLMAALRARGLTTTAAKVGPDFIDPGYHQMATGRASRNLDPWICGEDAIAPLTRRAASGDVCVIEGAMALFDGAADTDDFGSSAHVARLTRTPVILVVDASAIAGSVAAVVQGFARFDARVEVAGVILNRVGGDGHETLLRAALHASGVTVLGALREDPSFEWRERHLGLVPVVETPDAVRHSIERLAIAFERWCDVEAIVAIARRAPDLRVGDVEQPRHVARVRIGVAAGRAFSFMYPDNLESLQAAGAQVIPFDPMLDERLPDDLDGLYVGGGFPEVFAAELGANRPLIEDARRSIADGVITLAECGGLLWLCRSFERTPMVGMVPADATMTDGLSIGYRTVTARTDNPIAAKGSVLRGHEFHRSVCEPNGDALQVEGRFGSGRAGFATRSMLASYVHFMFGAAPAIAETFVEAAASYRLRRAGARVP